MTLHGYVPDRVERLHRRTLAALDDLRSISSSDPAAADALRAVRLLRHTLEQSWLPLLAAIRTSDAMTAWRARGPAPTPLAGWAVDLRTTGPHGAPATAGPDLDDLAPAALATALADAADELRGPWPDDPGRAYGRLLCLLHAVDRRAAGDPVAAPAIVDALGDDGLLRVVEAYDVAADAARVEPVAGYDRDAVVAAAAPGLARLLGARSRHGPGTAGAAWLREHLPTTAGIADAMAVAPDAFAPGLVVGTARWYLDLLRSDDGALVEAAASFRNANALLRAVARTSPVDAHALLADPATFELVTTAGWVDDRAAEELIVSALASGPRQGLVDPLDGLDVLADLVAVAADGRMRDGTSAGTALALGAYLPYLAPLLGAKEDDGGRSPLTVAVPTDDGLGIRGSRTIGTHADVARLVGELLEDERSQLALGLSVATYRADVLDDVAAWLRSAPPDDATLVQVEVGARLDGLHEVMELVEESADSQEALLRYEHAAAVDGFVTTLGWTSTAVGLFGPASWGSSTATTVLTRLAGEVARRTESPGLPATDLEDRQTTGLLVHVVALPLDDPAIRRALGLGDVPDELWHEVRLRIDVLRGAGDATVRATARDELRTLLAGDPDLARYVALAERDR